MNEAADPEHEERMTKDPVADLFYLREGIEFFYGKSDEFTGQDFIKIIEGAVVDRVIPRPGLVRCEAKNPQNSSEISFPGFMGMKALVTAVMEDREDADAKE